MTSIHTWSKTASENDDADALINWLEGQDPDTVNNSSRGMMQRLAEWRDDISIARESTGAADAYQITAASSPVALVDGMHFTFRAHQTNVGASTFKVNAFAAKPLRAKTATNLSSGDIQIGAPIVALYNLAADEFLIINSGFFVHKLLPSLISTYTLNALIPVGAVMPYPVATVPTGWIEANGQSLSTTAYPELFVKYAYTYGGSGSSFSVPDYRGEFLRGFDNSATNDPDASSRTDRGDGTTGDAVGTKQGQNTGVHGHTASSSTSVSVASGGAHTHQQTNNGYDQDYGVSAIPNTSGTPSGTGSTASTASTQSGGTHTHSASASTTTTVNNSTGSESRGRNVSVMFIVYAKPSAALAEMQGLTGLPYVFDDGIADVDPGSGRLSWNNAAAGSATELYVSETGPNSEPFGSVLATWDDLGTAVKGYLYLTKVGEPTTFAHFSVASNETDQGSYKKWTVTSNGSDGSFADGDNVNVIFSPAGSGTQGIKGDPGISGGVLYAFDNVTTTNADPGGGDLRLNNASLDSATEIAISYAGHEADAPDFEAFIKTWDNSTTTTNRGNLLVKKFSAPQNYAIYKITSAITDGTTYGRFTISYVDHAGSFDDADDLTVEFSATGDQGAAGAGSGDLIGANNLNDVVSAGTSRANLGLEIGTDVQAQSSNLDGWSALATSSKQAQSSNLDSWSALAPSSKANASLAGFDAISPTTTKGDILGHDGTDSIRVPVGTNGHYIEADSAEAAGFKWAAPSSGGLSTWSRKTSAYAAVSGDRLLADTVATAAFTITLPATPSGGEEVEIMPASAYETNNLTIDRNGETIMGDSADLVVNITVRVCLVYDGTDSDWRVS